MDIFFLPKWQDAVDILVISFLVHRLFLLFRRTSVLQILVGLISLWILHVIAQAAGLVLTSWFLEGFGAVAVLVIVVVFRNEIREVLIQTNPVRLFLGRPYQTQTANPTAIAQAAFQLAKNRTGALLVFQNRDRVAEHLREGVRLGGRFSPEIIESIFARESPVHDGAAVMRGNRIEQVGTFLPLTQREGLPQHFGSRHRAAIGLSEVCDAVVLAVSEERGEVSVVYRGEVEVARGPQQLERRIRRLLFGAFAETRPRSVAREWLTQAGGLLITFLLVSTFWGIYSGKQLSLINITTPIDFRNIPEYLELKKASEEKVEVQITGKRRLVSALKPEQVGAFVDLKDIGAGSHRLVLSAENIRIPLGLDVVRVTPSAIRLELEQRIEKELVVNPQIVGPPPAGYQIGLVVTNPESVKVSGPESVMRPIKSLSTEPIALQALDPKQQQQTFDVPLVLSPASLRLLAGQSKRVQVLIELKPASPAQPAPAASVKKKD